MTMVGPLLPVVAFLAIWYLAYGYRTALGLDRLSRRGCLVVAFVLVQVLVAVISEGTSLVRHFTARGVDAAWLAVVLITVIPAVLLFRRGPGVRVRLGRFWSAVRATSVWERVLAVLAAAELGVLIAIAWLYDVPNNADSLVYHLPRIAHWVQNGSVHHYPSHYEAANELSPLHEYNMAHLHLLAGTDRLDGFVQLLAVVISVVGASEIARLLGGSRRAQILAAAFAATIPSLILEATSTQNNDFAAATAVGVLVTLLAWRPTGRFVIGAALIGAAAGVGVLTKGTMVVLTAATALVLITVAVVEHRGLGALVLTRRVALGAVVAATLSLVVTGPFLYRNQQVYDGLSGPVSESMLNYDLTADAAAANVIRSVSGNFQIGDGTGVESWIGRMVRDGLHWMYEPLDFDPNDWHYTIGTYTDAFGPADYSFSQRNESIGANPWHVVLIVVALVLLTVLVLRGDRRLRVPLLLGLALVASFVIFAATTRWAPYVVRYQIPVLVAWCPLIALLVARAWRAVGAALVVVLLVLASPMLLDNFSRSMLHPDWDKGRGIEAHFRAWADESAAQRPVVAGEQAVAETIADTSCTSVGLANWIFYEYPMWIALENEGWHGRIDNVHVRSPSKSLADPRIGPCALIRFLEDATYVTEDPAMVSLRFGPMGVSLAPEMVVDQTPDQPGFHSDVLGVRVLPGSGWILGNGSPGMYGPARIHVFSNAARTVRVRTSTPGILDTTVALKPGPNLVELSGVAGVAGPVTAVSVLPG